MRRPPQVPCGSPEDCAEHAAAGHAAYPYQPQYAAAPAYGSYGFTAPSPWSGDGTARPHPTLAETPPHGFSVPGDLFATPYAPAPAAARPPVPDWMDDSGAWAAWSTQTRGSALPWETPPYGTPFVPEAAAQGSAAQGSV